MTYGLSPRVFIEDGAAVRAAEVQAQHSTARSWRALDEAHRLALIESALSAANDRIDAFPFVL